MRSQQFEDGRRNGIKTCVEWLSARAAEMNDPRARAILNTASFNLGVAMKRGSSPQTPGAKDHER